MAPRVLTATELNRTVLARQQLLERSAAPLPRVLERMGALQAQYAPSMYVGLWSRVRDLDRDALTRALVRRSVVQGTLMRSTIHLVSRADYWPLALAVHDGRRARFERSHREGPARAELDVAAARLREALGQGPLTRREVEAMIGKPATRAIHVWTHLVRAPPSGTWERRSADLWADAAAWVGPPPDLTPAGAVDHLVRRYLTGFGPAARKDVADWAGLPPGTVTEALERVAPRRFAAEDGTVLHDLPRAPIASADLRAPVRFLPTWDATLLTHARRAGILPEEHRMRVFNTRTPQSFPTFLVDGAVAGTWRFESGRVSTAPFARLSRKDAAAVDEEAERLAAFHR